jgi:two-component system, OmpR family, KDP operon response regulator KdpE
MSARLLVIDDEEPFLRTLATNLRGAGYIVETAGTAAGAIDAVARASPDAVVLDLLLPDGRGTDVCREVRRSSSVPIVVVSAVGEAAEKIAALDAGADDYVTKPFALGELLARLRAVLRRAAPSAGPVLRVGSLEIDRDARSARVDGDLVHLTPHEFDLLRVLAENEGKLMTHAAILRAVWGPEYRRESNYLHVFVSQLRRKVERDPARPRLILTAIGVGYRLVAPEES